LEPFAGAGVLRETELQLAGLIRRTVPDTSDEVLLAAALCVRAVQLGHACVELDRVAHSVMAEPTSQVPAVGAEQAEALLDPVELPWPEPGRWAAQLAASEAVAIVAVDDPDPTSAPVGEVVRPLVFDGTRVYLERYWRHERTVGDALLDGVGTAPVFSAPGPAVGSAHEPEAETDRNAGIEVALDRYFGPLGDLGPKEGAATGSDLQRIAAATALGRKVAIIAGGPGTGKTHTVARLLAAMHHLALDAGTTLDVALTAPTGKAAARMTEAVHQAVNRTRADDEVELPAEVTERLLATEASTIHRLLGSRGGITFRHNRDNPLPHDVIVVDETSMVDLPLMARLLDALGPDTRLVLVGDPFQLASVEAGAVLGDVVGPTARSDTPVQGPLSNGIVVLRQVHRFGEDSAIAELARAIRADDPQRTMEVLARRDHADLAWVDPQDTGALEALHAAVGEHAREVVAAAGRGEATEALALCKQLKVLCGTRFGSQTWTDDQERRLGDMITRRTGEDYWYPGRPVIVTRNDYITGVLNGDTGVVIDEGERHVVAMEGPEGIRRFAASQLGDVDTWWAMTIHKSQGSEFDHVIVSLPGATSPILTNELLYTAVTRAKQKVTVVADRDSIETAVKRRIARASGLGARLWP
jgi:exodeoxyribonuclease V alpha subunit